jgi:diguanylate cyclase (GGDEF)-like protein
VLRGLGNILLTQFRGSDVPCRQGGEEFLVVLPEASTEQVVAHAEQVRARVSNMNLAQPTGEPIGRITISVGIAEFPKHGGTAGELLKAADTALYRAKTAGRDRVEVF